MKTKIILVILVGLLFNCSNPVNVESEFLTDEQLVSILQADKDFNAFIEVRATALSEMNERFSKLDLSSRNKLSTIYQKYKDQNDFLSNSTSEEQDFIASITSSQSTQSLSVIIKRSTGNAAFSKEALVNLINDELKKVMITKATSKKDYKIAVDCEEVAMNAYFRALNANYYQFGMDIEMADLNAQIAGFWAGWGCYQA